MSQSDCLTKKKPLFSIMAKLNRKNLILQQKEKGLFRPLQNSEIQLLKGNQNLIIEKYNSLIKYMPKTIISIFMK